MLDNTYLVELEEKINEASDNYQIVRLIEEYLLNRLCENISCNANRMMAATIHNINEGEGNISVLSQTACLGYKQFKRIFAEYVGLNPKDFIQITRFRKAFNILQSTPQISISKVAYDCGYYDKSHLIKEFKMFTGYAPTQLLDICDIYTENLSEFNSVFINDNKELNNIAL